MERLQAMQEQMKETKKLLDDKLVEGESGDGRIKVVANGNRKIKNVSIDPSLLEDQEELEDTLLVALNRALTLADAVYENEMAGAAGGMLGGMGMNG